MFYSLLLLYTAVFSLIALLFSENILESSPCQSVLSPSPSAGSVMGGWSDVPQGAGAPLWASGLPARHPNQTVSSGYSVTYNTLHGPIRHHQDKSNLLQGFETCDFGFSSGGKRSFILL